MTAAVCEKCHRPLKDEVSQRRRYGPVCYRKKFGSPPPKPRSGAAHAAAGTRSVDQHPVDPDQLSMEDIMPNPVEAWEERAAREHAEAVARGEHDAKCEYLAVPGFYLCHCSKRRREAAGHTEPPGELIYQCPICPRCDEEVEHDGDSWTCHRCCCYWSDGLSNAVFYDDYGDLDADLAKYRERREKRAQPATA